MSKPSDEGIKKFLKAMVQKSGFSLENEVAKILKENNLSVLREVPFYDKDEQKGRRFDIRSTKSFPDESKLKSGVLHAIASYELVIECKNVPGNIWVFSEAENPMITFPAHASMNRDQKPDPVFNVIPLEPISDIPYVSGYDEYIFDKEKSNKQTDNLSSAVFSITKATRHEIDGFKKTFELFPKFGWPNRQSYILHFIFLQPLILFSGKIYVMKFNDKGEQTFQRVNAVQMPKGYVSKDYDEISGEIHIVEFSFLPQYLSKVDEYYRMNENIMIKHQKSFFDALKKVMPPLSSSTNLP